VRGGEGRAGRPPGRRARAPAAVLLDMDGLLVDSEPIWFEVECDVARRLGGTWTPEHQHALLGSSLPRAAAYLLEFSGGSGSGVSVDASVDEVAGWLLEGMATRLRAEPPPVQEGARGLLAALDDAGLPCALVSSSYRVLVDAVLASLGEALGSLPFTATVAGDEVAHRKPHPEPYLAAARLLGADPRRCVVLEDSPTGVASGRAAGCAVIAVPSLVPVEPAPGVRVLSSLAEIDADVLAAALSGGVRTGP